MESRILDVDAPRRLTFTWGRTGEVCCDLEPKGDKVLLTLVHRRISDRVNLLMVGAGWHMHLDILSADLTGTTPEPFWDGWQRLRGDYDRSIPGRRSAVGPDGRSSRGSGDAVSAPRLPGRPDQKGLSGIIATTSGACSPGPVGAADAVVA